MITARLHGNPIYFDKAQRTWKYSDNHESIDYAEKRVCPKCKKLPTKEGPDACLGTLPGVKFACCGHGQSGQGYIAFNNGVVIRGTFTKIKIGRINV